MYNSYDEALSNGIAAGFSAAYLIVVLILGVITLAATWKIYKKAGKPGWAAIVPFYTQYCMFEIVFGNGWLFLLLLVPCVNVIVGLVLNFKLAKAFGQGAAFGLGLLFLYPIFLIILGFGKYEYVGPAN